MSETIDRVPRTEREAADTYTRLSKWYDRLGGSEKYVYVAADVYRLPFAPALFDAATMIRTLHHMADARKALDQVRKTLTGGATFILEFANKHNLKSILRYWMRRQTWNPSISGSRMSQITTSGPSPASAESASRPVLDQDACQPSSSKLWMSDSPMMGSSSTTRMRNGRVLLACNTVSLPIY